MLYEVITFDKKGNLWVCGNSEARSIYYITPDKTVSYNFV